MAVTPLSETAPPPLPPRKPPVPPPYTPFVQHSTADAFALAARRSSLSSLPPRPSLAPPPPPLDDVTANPWATTTTTTTTTPASPAAPLRPALSIRPATTTPPATASATLPPWPQASNSWSATGNRAAPPPSGRAGKGKAVQRDATPDESSPASPWLTAPLLEWNDRDTVAGLFGATPQLPPGAAHRARTPPTGAPPSPFTPSTPSPTANALTSLSPTSATSLASPSFFPPTPLTRPQPAPPPPRPPVAASPPKPASPSLAPPDSTPSSYHLTPATPGTEQQSLERTLAQIIHDELDNLTKAFQEALFLHQNAATASHEIPPPAPKAVSNNPFLAPDEPDEFTSSRYPALPPSTPSTPSVLSPRPSPLPSPHPSPSLLSPDLRALHTLTSTRLAWRVKRLVEEEIEKGESSWRSEKKKAGEEFEGLERELGELEEKREAQARRMDELEKEVEKLRRQMQNEAIGHSEDLDNAARNAVLLQERVEILQAALNDPDAVREHHRPAAPADQDDSVWLEMLNSQGEILAGHTEAIAALSNVLSCPVCSELMTRATTLACGHSGCARCVEGWFARGQRSCPSCRVVTGPGTLMPAYALNEVIEGLKKMGMEEEGN